MAPLHLDFAAHAPLDPRVRAAMEPALAAGNPSSPHREGQAARALLDGARRRIAARLGVEGAELVFTASGSEAGAFALVSAVLARPATEGVLLSAIEHPCLLESAALLRRLGRFVELLPVDAEGVVQPEVLREALSRRPVGVVAVMAANNETGVIQPTPELAFLAREAGARFVVDAVQAPGRLGLRRLFESADLMTLSGHKFGGPQGSGLVVVRRGVELVPLIAGHQERGRRGGTENVAAAVGLAAALELAEGEQLATVPALTTHRDALEARLRAAFPALVVHGAGASRLPSHLSFRLPGLDGEALLIALDLEGIQTSVGAACASGRLDPSHVLLAMGVPREQARSGLRLSLGPATTAADIDRAFEALQRLIPRATR